MKARLLVLVAVTWMLALLLPRGVRAQDCSPERPQVVLTTRVEPPDQIIADALEEHLRTSLDARGIGLCLDAGEARDAVGFILLEITRPEDGTGPVHARIVIGDELTDKRVERTMNLSDVPPDARPLAVSASGDELLRASWAELMLTDAPPPKRAPPPAVVTALRESLRSPDELDDLLPTAETPPGVLDHMATIGALGHGAMFAKLQTFGGELHLGYWYREQWQVYARGAFSFSTVQKGVSGSVRQRTQGAAVGLSYAFFPVRGRLSLAAEADVGAHRVELIPSRRDDSVVELPTEDWTAEVTFGPRGLLTFGPVQLSLGLAMRIAIRPTEATAGGEVLLSNNRAGGVASIGIHGLL